MAVQIAVDGDRESLIRKFIEYAVLIIAISVIITTFKVSSGHLNINQIFEDAVTDSYNIGRDSIGGGALGAVVAIPLINLIGTISTIILAIGAGVITLVFLFGIRPSEILRGIIERRNENRQANREYREEHKADVKPVGATIGRPQEMEDEQIKIKLNNVDKQNNSHGLYRQVEETKEGRSKEELVLAHGTTEEDAEYKFPPIDLLKEGKITNKNGEKTYEEVAKKLRGTLSSFGVSARVESVSEGPTVTRYELKPAEGVRVNKIEGLADDIALNLAAETIRIEAPIPGTHLVGIEVPNKEREIVALKDIITSDEFESERAKSKLVFALGKDPAGESVVADIAKMPHVLIAGSTGSGKSVCLNTLIASLIYNAKPSEVKMVMIDPKMVELSVYEGIPHLLIPVVKDVKKAAGALNWAVEEMENRYQMFSSKNVRDIDGYNAALKKEGSEEKLTQIVIIIDELADLMMVAKKDVESAICRVAQKARAAGMHLVVATQRPSVDVITGLIKANIATRISFAVVSQIDSRTILDSAGAEKLLGKGDMLYNPVGAMKPIRVQGAYISDQEVEKIVEFLKQNGGPTYNEDVIEKIEKATTTDKELDEEIDDDIDPFLGEAIEMVVDMGQASASFIQRRFKVGYARAGRIIDQMEARGIISGYEGSKPRQVLITKDQLQEMKMSRSEDTNTEDD